MIASMDTEFPSHIRVSPLLNVLDMGPIDTNRHIVFSFTSNSAGMTADALAIITNEAEIYHTISSLARAQCTVG